MTLSVSARGVTVDGGSIGSFTLSWPKLNRSGKDYDPIERRCTGKKCSLAYEGGIGVDVEASDDGRVRIVFAGKPEGVKSFKTSMHIGQHFRQGGSWRIGDRSDTFPASKPPKPFLYQGNAREFRLTNFENKSLVFTVPPHSYQQLQDNLEWKWDIFAWLFIAPCDPQRTTYELTIARDLSSARRVILVDRFGQNAQKEYRGKISSVDELTEDAREEAQWYASLATPARDPYGGLPGSGARLGLSRTGFFRVEKKGGRWLLVDPDGNAFFQLGVCCMGPGGDYTYVKGREHIYEWLPPFEGGYRAAWHQPDWRARESFSFYRANIIRKYGRFDDGERHAAMVERLRRMGFNSAGAFSAWHQAEERLRFPRTPSLPLDRWTLGGREIVRGLYDPFDDRVRAKIDEVFAKRVAPRANDPLIIGYFLANEQGLEDIPVAVPRLDGTYHAKRRLVAMLRESHERIDAFNRAWGLDAQSFEELEDRGLPVSTKQAAADMERFTELLLNTYFSHVVETFRKYDRNHMLLGNRYQPGTANSEILCRVTGRHMDVFSVNYYTYGVERSFVDRLNRWSGGRPQLWSEFHYGSSVDTGVPGRQPVSSQRERGLAYRNYVEAAAATGHVVGVQWFQLIDQPLTGRWFQKTSGENFCIGLFNVVDRPYKPMIEEMLKTHQVIYDVLLGARPAYVFDDPRFRAGGGGRKTVTIPRAAGAMAIDGLLDGWPGAPPDRVGPERLVLGADAEGVDATFKLCWDEGALYVLARVNDPTPMMNAHAGAGIWGGDALELFVSHDDIDAGGGLRFSDRQVLLSAGRSEKGARAWVVNAPHQLETPLAVVPHGDGKGYTLEAAIAWEALGVRPRVGLELGFDLAVDDAADGKLRLRQLMWNGTARNSSDRSAWGRARLAH